MAESIACVNARASLEEIRTLKREFETAYDFAASSGKPAYAAKARELCRSIEMKAAALRETIAISEAERLFDLKSQYKRQTDLLKKAGLVEMRMEKDASGEEREVFFMTGIDNKAYPIPSYETIASRLFERRELFETKADQGFKKLVLIPFGMSLDAMFAKFKDYLLEYKAMHPEFARDDWADDSDVTGWNPLRIWGEEYEGADTNGTLVYDPISFDANHGGATKASILERQAADKDTFVGWHILFLQGGKNGRGFKGIPRDGKGEKEGTKIQRQDIEAGKSPREYLANRLAGSSDEGSAYRGESGMTPEEWIVLFMAHLEETGRSPDDFQNGTDSVVYLIGACFTASDSVLTAEWFSGGRRAILDKGVPSRLDKNYGVRFAVRV